MGFKQSLDAWRGVGDLEPETLARYNLHKKSIAAAAAEKSL